MSNLPPGTTENDIDERFGDGPPSRCEGCDQLSSSLDDGFCPDCQEDTTSTAGDPTPHTPYPAIGAGSSRGNAVGGDFLI